MFKQGFQVFALPTTKGVWQFALFVIGREIWSEHEDDHASYMACTWFLQLAFWQFTYTRECTDKQYEAYR